MITTDGMSLLMTWLVNSIELRRSTLAVMRAVAVVVNACQREWWRDVSVKSARSDGAQRVAEDLDGDGADFRNDCNEGDENIYPSSSAA